MLVEFRDRCHKLYIAHGAAETGLRLALREHNRVIGANTSGTIGFVSRAEDFSEPPLSKVVPRIDLDEYRAALAGEGQFTQYQHRALIVFIYQLWEDLIRDGISKMYGLDHNKVRCDLMGDLRHVRNDIIHRNGRTSRNMEFPFLSLIWKRRGGDWVFNQAEIRALVDQISALQVYVSS